MSTDQKSKSTAAVVPVPGPWSKRNMEPGRYVLTREGHDSIDVSIALAASVSPQIHHPLIADQFVAVLNLLERNVVGLTRADLVRLNGWESEAAYDRARGVVATLLDDDIADPDTLRADLVAAWDRGYRGRILTKDEMREWHDTALNLVAAHLAHQAGEIEAA